jgi:hypothetical protein
MLGTNDFSLFFFFLHIHVKKRIKKENLVGAVGELIVLFCCQENREKIRNMSNLKWTWTQHNGSQ